jgi:AcrR family transcriptional regulator
MRHFDGRAPTVPPAYEARSSWTSPGKQLSWGVGEKEPMQPGDNPPPWSRAGGDAAETAIYDPAAPVVSLRGGRSLEAPISRRSQRLRRARILATIRQLLIDGGFENVTMRRIAEASGHAIQTIYNLVGPRDQAIIEAIGEYTRFVGRTAAPRPDDPYAVLQIIDRWVLSIKAQPEFCRQVSLISFTGSRHIFYAFRERQLKGMQGLLLHQQKCGVLRGDVDAREHAELLVLLASAVCTDWADRGCSLEQLQRRLYKGFADLIAGALVTDQRDRQDRPNGAFA